MAKLYLLFAFAVVQVVTYSSVKSAQQIVFHTRNGDYDFNVDQPNLSLTWVREVCNTGVWIAYIEQNYVYKWSWVAIYPDLETTCTTPSVTEIGSARRVGLHDNHTAPSVTLFTGIAFQGEAVAFEGEIPHITFDPRSLVTIDTSVEFFQLQNFQGESVCFQVYPEFCRGVVCWVWEFYFQEFPWGTPPRSARAGCSSSAKVVRPKVNKSGSATTVTKQQ